MMFCIVQAGKPTNVTIDREKWNNTRAMVDSLLDDRNYTDHALQLLTTCPTGEAEALEGTDAHGVVIKQTTEFAGRKAYLEMRNPSSPMETFIFLTLAHAQNCNTFVHFMPKPEERQCPCFKFIPWDQSRTRNILTGVLGGYRKHEITLCDVQTSPSSVNLRLSVTSTKLYGIKGDYQTADPGAYHIEYSDVV